MRSFRAFVALVVQGISGSEPMLTRMILAISPALALVACGSETQPRDPEAQIEVRHPEQDRLHELSEPDLEIALKRAILAAGYKCQRAAKAGFVAKYKNLDMWTTTCSEGRQWAVFAGPDGTAQVRDCGDVARFGLPECRISKQPPAAPDAA